VASAGFKPDHHAQRGGLIVAAGQQQAVNLGRLARLLQIVVEGLGQAVLNRAFRLLDLLAIGGDGGRAQPLRCSTSDRISSRSRTALFARVTAVGSSLN
jgi:hypothetical protein